MRSNNLVYFTKIGSSTIEKLYSAAIDEDTKDRCQNLIRSPKWKLMQFFDACRISVTRISTSKNVPVAAKSKYLQLFKLSIFLSWDTRHWDATSSKILSSRL